MEIPSIQLSLEHIEELDFTCPAAKKSINIDRKSTRLKSSHVKRSRMPSSA